MRLKTLELPKAAPSRALPTTTAQRLIGPKLTAEQLIIAHRGRPSCFNLPHRFISAAARAIGSYQRATTIQLNSQRWRARASPRISSSSSPFRLLGRSSLASIWCVIPPSALAQHIGFTACSPCFSQHRDGFKRSAVHAAVCIEKSNILQHRPNSTLPKMS